MAEALSVGGLASGLDTNAIIDGLTDLEQLRVTREVRKQIDVEDQKKAYEDLVTRIANFASKADSISDMENFNLYSASSNLEENATISGGEQATPGSFELEIEELASSQKIASGAFASTTVAMGFAGSFEVSNTTDAIENDPSKTTTEIELLASDTLQDVMNKINASDAIGVSASILTLGENDNRLVLTSKGKGSNMYTMNELTGNVLTNTGLGLIGDTQRAQTSYDFKLGEGGPAKEASLLSDLSTGIGQNNLTDGDILRINGTMADGSAATQTDLVIDTATTTMADILSQIEVAFGSSVTANLNDSGEIQILDTSSGAIEMTLDLSFVDSDASGSSLALGSSKIANSFTNLMQEGKKAFFTLDGIASSSNGNKAEGIVQGTTFNLKKVTDPGETIQLSLGRDFAGITEKVSGFMEEYNSLLKFIDEKTKVQVSESDQSQNDFDSNDSKEDESKKGVLAGDMGIRRLRNEIQSIMTSSVAELEDITQYTSLSRVGITTNGSTGFLEMDKEEFEKAIKTDFDGVRRLFASSGYSDNPNHELGRFTKDTVAGIYNVDADSNIMGGVTGTRIGKVLTGGEGNTKGLSIEAEAGTGSGTFTFSRGLASKMNLFYEVSNDYVDGIFKQTTEAYDTRIDRFDQRINDMQDRVDRFRASLIKEYAALEQSVQRLNSQSSAFQAQMSSLR
jgi:flagellar hook-associated protein 2